MKYPDRAGDGEVRARPASMSQKSKEKLAGTTNKHAVKFDAWEAKPKTRAGGTESQPLVQTEFHSGTKEDCDSDQHVKKETSKKPSGSNKKLVAPFYGQTTNKAFFPKLEIKEPVVTMHRRQLKPPPSPRKARFDSMTSYKSDNPGFLSGYPKPRLACAPHVPELDLFLPTRNDHFMTEQRTSFRQFQRGEYSPVQTVKQEEKYIPPRVSIDATTSHKTHFPYKDVKSAKTDHLRPQTQLRMIGETDEFHDDTTNTAHFRHWHLSPRVRHGDRYERGYVPSNATHEMTTIYSSEFQPIKCRPATSCKPVNDLIQDEDDFLKFEVIAQ